MHPSPWSSVCVACGAPRKRGVLCEACVCGLVDDEVCPEQIVSKARSPEPGHENAWLIDGFGVPHTVSVLSAAPPHLRTVQLGRRPSSDVQICERTISQLHATLEHRPLSNAWFVVDVDSDNGVFVGADRVPRRFPLERGDRIWLGRRVGFVFIPLEACHLDDARADIEWVRPGSFSGDTVGDDGTTQGPTLKVHGVTEGGAVCVVGRDRIALSELEYELILTLHRRLLDEVHKDETVRGFVPAGYLLEALSWRSEAPTHANLRGLVKKLRKKLADRDPPIDVIASQQGLGYRLARVIEVD